MSIHIRWSFHTYAGCVDIPSVAFLILCCVAISLTPWWSFVIYNNPPFAYEPLKSLSQMFYTLMVIHNNPLFVYEPLKSLSQMFSRGVLGWSSVQICTWAPQMFFRGVLEWSSVQLCTWAPAFTLPSFLVGFCPAVHMGPCFHPLIIPSGVLSSCAHGPLLSPPYHS